MFFTWSLSLGTYLCLLWLYFHISLPHASWNTMLRNFLSLVQSACNVGYWRLMSATVAASSGSSNIPCNSLLGAAWFDVGYELVGMGTEVS